MTITEYIAALKDPTKRQTITEIDLLTAKDHTPEQQKELIDLLVALSLHATSTLDVPHQIKSIKLRGNFPITYSQLLAIINSGIEHFWLHDCEISLEETLTGRIFEDEFVPEAKRIEGLCKNNILLSLKLENCKGLDETYLSYLLTRLSKLQKLSLRNSDFGSNSGEIVKKFRLYLRSSSNSNNSPNKTLTRQPKHTNFFDSTFQTKKLTTSATPKQHFTLHRKNPNSVSVTATEESPESSTAMRRLSFSDVQLDRGIDQNLATPPLSPTTPTSSRSNSSNSASTATPPDTPKKCYKQKTSCIKFALVKKHTTVTAKPDNSDSDDSSENSYEQHANQIK